VHMCRRRICKLYKYREHGVHDVHLDSGCAAMASVDRVDRGSGDCHTIVWYQASGQMLKLTPPERTDARGSSDAHANRPAAALGTALEVTVFRLRCRLRRSGYGSGHCPATVWCHTIGQILKLTPPERTDAYGSSDVHTDRAPSAARYGAQSNGISVTVSAEAVGSWIRRLSHHRVSSDERSGAQTHPGRPYRRAWKLRCTRRRSARRRSVWRSK